MPVWDAVGVPTPVLEEFWKIPIYKPLPTGSLTLRLLNQSKIPPFAIYPWSLAAPKWAQKTLVPTISSSSTWWIVDTVGKLLAPITYTLKTDYPVTTRPVLLIPPTWIFHPSINPLSESECSRNPLNPSLFTFQLTRCVNFSTNFLRPKPLLPRR